MSELEVEIELLGPFGGTRVHGLRSQEIIDHITSVHIDGNDGGDLGVDLLDPIVSHSLDQLDDGQLLLHESSSLLLIFGGGLFGCGSAGLYGFDVRIGAMLYQVRQYKNKNMVEDGTY